MPIQIQYYDKTLEIKGSLTPVKFFVKEYFVKEVDYLGITDCEVKKYIPANDITAFPDYASLNYDFRQLTDTNSSLKIHYVTADCAEFSATIMKGSVSGKAFDCLKKGIDLDNLSLNFEYYPVVL